MGEVMKKIDDIKNDSDLVNSIDWDMTPEEAISLHLEWGPLRSQSYYNSRCSDNETIYFVIDTWKIPVIKLIRRKGFDAYELAKFDIPDDLKKDLMEDIGKHKGVYAIYGDIKKWLMKKILER